jgi:tight adherence protein C
VFLVLAVMCGAGVFLAVAGPSIGIARPNLVVRLRRLDPDAWWDEPAPELDAGAFFRPLGEDTARLAGRVLGSLGLIPPHDLPRALAQAESSMQVHEFYFEKVLTALVLQAVALVANVAFERLGLTHIGIWPLWLWLGLGVLGFVWPDLEIRRRARRYRTRVRAELPTLVDLLAVAVSTGRGIEDAVVDVTPFLAGPLGREWGRVEQHLIRGLPAALEEVATRTSIPEMDTLTGYLVAAYQRGQSLEGNLVQLSETLRERRLHEVTAAGGRATERMFLPLVLFVIVPLLLLVIAPAAASLFGLVSTT